MREIDLVAWNDVRDRKPQIGNKIEVLLSDSPDGQIGEWTGSVDIKYRIPDDPDFDWTVSNDETGLKLWVRYWRLVN